MNTTELLTIANAIVPNRTAIVYENRRITYQQMLDRVNRLANALSYYGVSPGDRVAMLQVNCNEHIEAYFAAAKLDAVYVPINFRSRAQEIAYMLNDSAPLVLIAGSRYIDLIQPIMGTLKSVKIAVSLEKAFPGWLCYEDLLASFTGEERVPQGDGDDLTMLMFTAGTTGSPKAVMLSHDSFSSYIFNNVTPADPDIEEKNILTVPLYHVAGVQAVMAGIYGGRTLITQKQFEPKEWMELVEKERANRAMLVPTMLQMLMDHKDFDEHDLSSLEVVTYGASSMPLQVIRRAISNFPNVRFINAFGQTETAATITMLPPEDHILEGSPDQIEKKLTRLTSVGKPLEDVEVRVVDDAGNTLSAGQVGEIVAKGPRMMKGYWNRQQDTEEILRSGWLYTGDLGYLDEDGYIFLSGRAKDFIKRGGEMISPEEVEQVLHSHPAIEEAAVIGILDENWGERVAAVVVTRGNMDINQRALIEYCREHLASFKNPELVFFVNALPRNALGKVLKRVLREQYSS